MGSTTVHQRVIGDTGSVPGDTGQNSSEWYCRELKGLQTAGYRAQGTALPPTIPYSIPAVLHSTTQYPLLYYSLVSRNPPPHPVHPCTTVYPQVPSCNQQYHAVPHSTSQYPTVPGTQLYPTVAHTVTHSTQQYNTVPHCTQQYNTVPHDTPQ